MSKFFRISRQLSMMCNVTDEVHGLSVLQMRILHYISQHKKVKMSDLAARFMVKPATMTQQIDHLVEKKFVERIKDLDDRRIVRLKLAKKVKKDIRKKFKTKLKEFSWILKDLSDKEKKDLFSIVSKIENCVTKKKKE